MICKVSKCRILGMSTKKVDLEYHARNNIFTFYNSTLISFDILRLRRIKTVTYCLNIGFLGQYSSVSIGI